MADANKIIDDTLKSIEQWVNFNEQYLSNDCFRAAVNNKYRFAKTEDENRSLIEKGVDAAVSLTNAFSGGWDETDIHVAAAQLCYGEYFDWAKGKLENCLRNKLSKDKSNATKKDGPKQSEEKQPEVGDGPFDRRLYRDFVESLENGTKSEVKIPFSSAYSESATSGLIMGESFLKESEIKNLDNYVESTTKERKSLQNDSFFSGAPSLINTYSLTKLYGSEGGSKLVNARGERRWYEIDQAIGMGGNIAANYSSNPTTSSIISWGNGDPYARTPYHFTDFVFSKYWNKIENNRLITLRRFAAPIYDNMKFPGMDGVTKLGTPADEQKGSGSVDKGSSSKIVFPPMAHAVTYFGEETGNKLSEILKFSTGLRWEDAESDVWKVDANSTPDNESLNGAGSLFGGLGKLSKMLAVAGGDYDPQLIMNSGVLPPDPYSEGPYENRILGPVNRIDSTKKRKAGLDFKMEGLKLQFEYLSRPVGGVNPKAVILDIMSNFLIIGSASAVFFGGQHRFMGNPAKYPFLGGDKGIEAWYSGKPMEWAGHSIKQFAGQVTNEEGGLAKGAGSFFDQLLGKTGEGGIKGVFGAIKGLFSSGGIGSNIVKHHLAAKTAGTIPYLTNLKALLTGEPIGEWHVTIGNPLNPIALIGNLVCTGIEIEFGDELGPDDFPTEIKIVVSLDHGMPRDRDAIQSMFNRGMGRIYDLPDHFEGSADGQSKIDDYTAHASKTGTALPIKGWFAGPSKLGGKSGPSRVNEKSAIYNSPTVWNRAPFVSVSPNENLTPIDGDIGRTAYRKVDWIALKSLR